MRSRAKATEGKSGMAEVTGPRKTEQPPERVASRLRAGRTAQDMAPSSDGGRVAIRQSVSNDKVGGVASACSAFVMRRELDVNRDRTSGDSRRDGQRRISRHEQSEIVGLPADPTNSVSGECEDGRWYRAR